MTLRYRALGFIWRDGFLSDVCLWLFVLALFGSISLNLVLANRLRVANALIVAPAGLISGDSIREGLKVTDLQGSKRLLKPSPTKPTLLYVFSPLCRYCEANEAAIQSLIHQTDRRVTPVLLALTSSNLNDYIKRHKIQVPVYLASGESIQRYRFWATPECVLINTSGVVEHVWNGQFTLEQTRSIEQHFGVVLPHFTIGPSVPPL